MTAILGAATAAAGAQAVIGNDTMRVELIGLKHWTIPMIQDSLARYAPKETLLSHTCAANLRQFLKFADASSLIYPSEEGGRERLYFAVTVMEPEDSALVRYRRPYQDSLPVRTEWLPATRVLDDYSDQVQYALQKGFLFDSGSHTGVSPQSDSAFRSTLPLRTFLQTHHSESDIALARRTLATDGNTRNRLVALLIIADARERDDSWRTVVETLRDPSWLVGGIAGEALVGMQQLGARQIDWAPSAATLRLLLGGTNLFQHNAVMSLLVKTKIDPALAPILLADNSRLVLAKLASTGAAERRDSHAFLVQMASRDYGSSPSSWTPWLNSLGLPQGVRRGNR